MGYAARTLVEAIPAPAAILDPDGRVLVANGRWTAPGRDSDLCPAEGAFLSASPGPCGAHKSVLEAVWHMTAAVAPARLRCRCDGTTERIVEVSALPDDGTGEQRRLVTVTAAETGVDTRAEFLALLSHEARTPVTTVVAAVELLRAQPLEQGVREIVDNVYFSTKALETLTDNLLDLGRLETGRLHLAHEPVTVRTLLDGVVEPLQREARSKGILLLTAPVPDFPAAVMADSRRLRQVLDAVVGNAVKFTPAGEVVVLAEASGDGTWVMTVSDTGPGIAAPQRARIFQPFTQADSSAARSHEGAGLGLALASRLVARMGGAIEVESAPGAGALFRIRLPLEAVPSPAPAGPRPLDGRRIAVVAPTGRSTQALSWLLAEAGAAPVAAGFDEIVRPMPGVDTVLWCDDAHDPEAQHRADTVRRAAGPDGQALMISTTDPRTGLVRRPGVLTAPLILNRLVAALNQERTGVRGAPVTVAPLSGGRVLLAEDNEVNRTVFRRMIELMGVTCDTVADGAAAVQETLGGAGYDVVLMDVQMPRTDGLEATRLIRAAGCRTPILALTATAPADRDRCLAAGMDGRLSKPITLPELRSALEPYLHPVATAPPGEAGDDDAVGRLISRIQNDGDTSPVMTR